MERNFNYDDVPVVETQSGLLKGYSMDHVYIFKGIPYAQAKRFRMPEPVRLHGKASEMQPPMDLSAPC